MLAEDVPKLKYKIITSQTHLRHAHIFIAKRDVVLLPKAIVPCSAMLAQVFIHISRVRNLVVHVGAGIDTLLRELRERHLEALFDRLQNSLVFGAADERDTETLGSETTGTTDTVEV